MRKIKLYVNNIERLEVLLGLRKRITKVKLNKLLCENNLKSLIKKIPKEYDKKTIFDFEKETGIILKYEVYNSKYEYLEYTKNGEYPSREYNEFNNINILDNYLAYYDILVVIKKY